MYPEPESQKKPLCILHPLLERLVWEEVMCRSAGLVSSEECAANLPVLLFATELANLCLKTGPFPLSS